MAILVQCHSLLQCIRSMEEWCFYTVKVIINHSVVKLFSRGLFVKRQTWQTWIKQKEPENVQVYSGLYLKNLYKLFKLVFPFYPSGIQACLSALHPWDFSPSSSRKSCTFFFALRSRSMLFLFSHSRLSTLARASLSLAFRTVGEAGKA